MPTVQQVLREKSLKTVHSIEPMASVLGAVHKMNELQVGALVVMNGSDMVGMFTERDVLKRVLGQNRSPEDTQVADVMTTDVVCCGPLEEIDDVAATMKTRRIRHLPVCDPDGKLQGMISIGDVTAQFASKQEATIYFLNEYIYGRV